MLACLCALYFASLKAAGAHASLAHIALLVADGDLLHVGAEGTIGYAVGVAYATSSHRMLPANFAYL